MKKLKFTAEEIDTKLEKVETIAAQAQQTAEKAADTAKKAEQIAIINSGLSEINAAHNLTKKSVTAVEAGLQTVKETIGAVKQVTDETGHAVEEQAKGIEALSNSLKAVNNTVDAVSTLASAAKDTANATKTAFETFYKKDDSIVNPTTVFGNVKKMVVEHGTALTNTESSIVALNRAVTGVETIANKQADLIKAHADLITEHKGILDGVKEVSDASKQFLDTHKAVLENTLSATDITNKINTKATEVLDTVATNQQVIADEASAATAAAGKATEAVAGIGDRVAEQMEIAFGTDDDPKTNANVKAIRKLANEAKDQAKIANDAATGAAKAAGKLQETTDKITNETIPGINSDISLNKQETSALKSTVELNYNELSGKYTTLNSNIEASKKKVADLDTALNGDSNDPNNPGIKATITEAQNSISTAKSDITTAQQNISKLTSDLTAKQTWITNAENRLKEAEKVMGGLDDKFKGVDDKIQGAKKDLQDAQARVDTLVNTTLPGISDRIEEAKNTISTLETNLTNTINTKKEEIDVAVAAVDKKITDTKNLLSTATNRITEAEKSVKALDSKIAEANKTVVALQQLAEQTEKDLKTAQTTLDKVDKTKDKIISAMTFMDLVFGAESGKFEYCYAALPYSCFEYNIAGYFVQTKAYHEKIDQLGSPDLLTRVFMSTSDGVYSDITALIEKKTLKLYKSTDVPTSFTQSKKTLTSQCTSSGESNYVEFNENIATYYWVKMNGKTTIHNKTYGGGYTTEVIETHDYKPVLRLCATAPGNGLMARIAALELALINYRLLSTKQLAKIYAGCGIDYENVPVLAFTNDPSEYYQVTHLASARKTILGQQAVAGTTARADFSTWQDIFPEIDKSHLVRGQSVLADIQVVGMLSSNNTISKELYLTVDPDDTLCELAWVKLNKKYTPALLKNTLPEYAGLPGDILEPFIYTGDISIDGTVYSKWTRHHAEQLGQEYVPYNGGDPDGNTRVILTNKISF